MKVRRPAAQPRRLSCSFRLRTAEGTVGETTYAYCGLVHNSAGWNGERHRKSVLPQEDRGEASELGVSNFAGTLGRAKGKHHANGAMRKMWSIQHSISADAYKAPCLRVQISFKRFSPCDHPRWMCVFTLRSSRSLATMLTSMFCRFSNQLCSSHNQHRGSKHSAPAPLAIY